MYSFKSVNSLKNYKLIIQIHTNFKMYILMSNYKLTLYTITFKFIKI